jgi:hypothetical protein
VLVVSIFDEPEYRAARRESHEYRGDAESRA